MARRNTGSVRQRRPGVFQVSVDLSKVRKLTPQEWASPLTQRRRYETVEGTREEAERRLHEMLYQADTGTLPTGRVTLNIWLEYWMREYVGHELAPSTVEDYRMLVRNYLSPMLGTMYLQDLKAHHIQEFQNRLAGKVGSSVVRKLRQVLSGALREAVNCDLIPTNPVKKTRTSKVVQNKVMAPSVEQVQQLLADAADDKYFPALWLIALTGLRAGEALGLEWRHIDVLGRRVLVRQAMVETGDGRFLSEPKSEKGKRGIPLDDATLDVLMSHREAQDAHRERMGERYAPYRDETGAHWLVFPTMYGGLNRTSTLLYALRKYAPQLHTHQLRHFFGTQLMEAGVALPRVSALMGHSSIAVTAAIYLHPDVDGDRDAIDLLATRMSGGKVGGKLAEDVKALLVDTN